jgi:LPXTG-motif cell wall-anchored protein
MDTWYFILMGVLLVGAIILLVYLKKKGAG